MTESPRKGTFRTWQTPAEPLQPQAASLPGGSDFTGRYSLRGDRRLCEAQALTQPSSLFPPLLCPTFGLTAEGILLPRGQQQRRATLPSAGGILAAWGSPGEERSRSPPWPGLPRVETIPWPAGLPGPGWAQERKSPMFCVYLNQTPSLPVMLMAPG